MSETVQWSDERRDALVRRLYEYGAGYMDPTEHENDCAYAAGIIRWLQKRLEERDKFIVAKGMWQDFVETLPKPAESSTVAEKVEA